MPANRNPLQAIEARRNGVWDDRCLVAFGPLSTNTDDDVAAIKRAFLADCGFVVGPRDPRINRNYPGAFMVAESHDESELPTDDGSNGPWCIVGDDEPDLVNRAFDFAADVYGEDHNADHQS